MNTNKIILSNNLNNLLKKNKVTKPGLAAKLNLPYNTVLNWTVARTYPGITNMQKLSNFFGVSKAYLVEDHKKMPKNAVIDDANYKKLPVIGQIACGNPIEAIKETGKYRLTSTKNLPEGINYWLKCKGDSMFPTITSGSFVLIHQIPDVENGEIAAVQLKDDEYVTLKRVIKQARVVILKPDNPKFDPIILNKDNPGEIIGHAIRVEKDL